jgi:hypothetical protein
MKKLTISVLAAIAIASLALVQLASAHADRSTAATTTAIQVKGGEFFFRLSTKSWEGHVRLQEHRPRPTRLQHPWQEDAADPARQDGEARRQLHEERQVRLPVHRPRTCPSRDEGDVHRPLTITNTTRRRQ